MYIASINNVSDDVKGYSRNAVLKIAEDIKAGKLISTPDSYSAHHYELSADYPAFEIAAKTDSLENVIGSVEGRELEFKSTLCTNLHTGKKDDAIEFTAMKTIVAFLNSSGGRLVIGYNEKGNEIIGIETDLPFVKHNDLDGFGLKLDTLINNHIGKEFNQFIKISYKTDQGKTLCLIDVSKCPKDAFLLKKNEEPAFFIRMNSSTERLNIVEYQNYKSMKS